MPERIPGLLSSMCKHSATWVGRSVKLSLIVGRPQYWLLVYWFTGLMQENLSAASDQLRLVLDGELVLQMHCPAASFMPVLTIPNHCSKKLAKSQPCQP
jgi:hypothetical protein